MRGLTEEGKKHLADIRWVVKTMHPFQPFDLNSDLKAIDDMDLEFGEDKSDELIDYVYTKMYDVFLLLLNIVDLDPRRVFSGEYILKLLKVYNRILDDYGFILDDPQEASYHIMKYDESRITASASDLKRFVSKNLKVLRKDSNKSFRVTWDDSMDNLILEIRSPYQESEEESDKVQDEESSYEDGVVLIDEEELEECEKLSAPYGDHSLPSFEELGEFARRIDDSLQYDGDVLNLDPDPSSDEDDLEEIDFEEDDEFEDMDKKMDEVKEQPPTFPNFMDMIKAQEVSEIEGHFSEDEDKEDFSAYFNPEDKYYEKKVELFKYFERKGVEDIDKLIEFINDTLNSDLDPIKYFNNIVTGYYGKDVFEKTDRNEIHQILNPITGLDSKEFQSLTRLRQIRDLELLTKEKSKLLDNRLVDVNITTEDDKQRIKDQDPIIKELIRIARMEHKIIKEEIESGMIPPDLKLEFLELENIVERRIADMKMLITLSELLDRLDS